MAIDQGRGADSFGVSVSTGAMETGGHCTLFRVEKWDDDQIGYVLKRNARDPVFNPCREPGAREFREFKVKPFGVYELDDANLILNAGWQAIMNGIAGSAVTKLANTTPGRIGGGISSTAVTAAQTDLQAATGAANRQWEMLNAVPTVGSTGAAGLILAAQFPTTDGNFAWAEFGVDTGTAAGTGASVAPMYSRGLATPGTKTSAQTWNTTVTITWI